MKSLCFSLGVFLLLILFGEEIKFGENRGKTNEFHFAGASKKRLFISSKAKLSKPTTQSTATTSRFNS
jgi:hypothetical protein